MLACKVEIVSLHCIPKATTLARKVVDRGDRRRFHKLNDISLVRGAHCQWLNEYMVRNTREGKTQFHFVTM